MGDPSEPWRGHRDARWMVMWPLTSLVSATCAFALVWVAVGYGASRSEDGLTVSLPTLAARSVAFFLVYALSGAVLGLLVALVLTFLVGDAHGRRAEQAARLVGGGTYAVAGLVVGAAVSGGAGYLLVLVVTSMAVGVVAGWWHRRLASRPRVEDYYAH